MRSAKRAGLLLAYCWVSIGAFAGVDESLNVSAIGRDLVAVGEHGQILWKVRLSGPATVERETADGLIRLDDGYVIDVAGRVLLRSRGVAGKGSPSGGDKRGGQCPHWSPLAEITPPSGDSQSNSHEPPLFDSQGNAWVINTFLDSGNYELQVRKSNAHDGTWGPLETISNTTSYVSGPHGTIDGNDIFTIIFRDIASTYRLYSMRYTPGTGWAGPDLVYGTSNFFQAIRVGSDELGDVVAVFDPSSGATNDVWSIAYDAATETWGSAARVSHAGYDTLLPTLVRNESGDVMYLLYLVLGGGPTGIYAHRFDSTTRTWGPAQQLPGTSTAYYGIAASSSRLPATVNADGDLTVFWQSSYPYAVYASRITGGWPQSPWQLLPPGGDNADMENFSHAASTEYGDALGVLTRFEDADARVHFYAFRHRLGAGWDPPENPYSFVYNGTTRSRIAPYRGSYAVATLLAPQGGTVQITSASYERSAWQPDLLDMPQSYESYFQEIGADGGEALSVFEGEQIFGDNFGIWATWLRNLPGDLDSDGVVDLSDLALLLAGYGVDESGDVNGDGVTNLADLADLLAGYGRTCP